MYRHGKVELFIAISHVTVGTRDLAAPAWCAHSSSKVARPGPHAERRPSWSGITDGQSATARLLRVTFVWSNRATGFKLSGSRM
jgi:hypothetical protein